MAVIIGTVTLNNVLDWEDENEMSVPIKRKVRASIPYTQIPYFVRKPKTIIIKAKLNRTEKTDVRNLKNELSWQPLYDYDGSFVDYVWIEMLNNEWRGQEDYDYPWVATLTLICSST